MLKGYLKGVTVMTIVASLVACGRPSSCFRNGTPAGMCCDEAGKFENGVLVGAACTKPGAQWLGGGWGAPADGDDEGGSIWE